MFKTENAPYLFALIVGMLSWLLRLSSSQKLEMIKSRSLAGLLTTMQTAVS
jgi:hypothetical protein